MYLSFREFVENSSNLELFHGSNSEQISGPLRTNERDSGWFGSGFYLTAYPEYAKRWGNNVYKMIIPHGNFAHVVVEGNYKKINYIGDTNKANELAGGTEGWIENEHVWSQKFTSALKSMGYDGIRVEMNGNPDVEVLVFNPQIIQVVEKMQ